jgi:hypothetical protein
VCLPPALQARLCDALAARPNVGTVVLEKPVAADPEAAARVYEKLVASGKAVIVDYSFLYAKWYEPFGALLSAAPEGSASIAWTFRAHHYRHDLANWKRDAQAGGGVVRFFGIHVIALLASLGYTQVVRSRLESAAGQASARWVARFMRPAGPAMDVTVDSNADAARFALSADAQGAPMLETDDPFTDPAFVPRWPGEDRRIAPLARMLRAAEPDASRDALYRLVNALWAEVERCSGADS